MTFSGALNTLLMLKWLSCTSLCAVMHVLPIHRDADRGQNSTRQVGEQQEDSKYELASVQVFLSASSTVSVLIISRLISSACTDILYVYITIFFQ